MMKESKNIISSFTYTRMTLTISTIIPIIPALTEKEVLNSKILNSRSLEQKNPEKSLKKLRTILKISSILITINVMRLITEEIIHLNMDTEPNSQETITGTILPEVSEVPMTQITNMTLTTIMFLPFIMVHLPGESPMEFNHIIHSLPLIINVRIMNTNQEEQLLPK